jgi:hypothetical protein
VQSHHTDEHHSARAKQPAFWQATGINGLELLHGKYRTLSFARHFHEAFVIGVVETGGHAVVS